MNNKISEQLVILANHLDQLGLEKEADDLDVIIKEAFMPLLGALICGIGGCKKSGTDIGWDYEWDVLKENIINVIPYGDMRIKLVPEHPHIDVKTDTVNHHYPEQGQQIVVTWKCAEAPAKAGVEDGPGLKDDEYAGDLLDITYVWCADLPAADKNGDVIEGAYCYGHKDGPKKPSYETSSLSSCPDSWDEVDKPEIPNCGGQGEWAAHDGHLQHQENS